MSLKGKRRQVTADNQAEIKEFNRTERWIRVFKTNMQDRKIVYFMFLIH